MDCMFPVRTECRGTVHTQTQARHCGALKAVSLGCQAAQMEPELAVEVLTENTHRLRRFPPTLNTLTTSLPSHEKMVLIM